MSASECECRFGLYFEWHFECSGLVRACRDLRHLHEAPEREWISEGMVSRARARARARGGQRPENANRQF